VHSAAAIVAQAKVAGFTEKVIKIQNKSVKGWVLLGDRVGVIRDRAS
jgi:hypothetical protein